MLKEIRGVDYAITIIRIAQKHGELDSKNIHKIMNDGGFIIDASLSYLQKILQRMVKYGILSSSGAGYTLNEENATLDKVLNLCDMPDNRSPSFDYCCQLKQMASDIKIA